MSADDADILAMVRAQFHATPPARLAVAVSGGGDSTALLHILARCFDPDPVELFALSVDHGLRPEAADEAAQVGVLANRLGVRHEVLKWTGWDGSGNLQDQARRARYRLLTDWAKANEIAVLALGHTADDQAETVVMRLARSSGVTGLAGISARRTVNGVTICRPMLGLGRNQLRTYLRRNDVAWSEDPSNVDLRYDRIKARQTLELLEPLGVTATALSNVARNMSKAREALDWYSFLAARELAVINGGDVVLELHKYRTLPDEIARRLLQRAFQWISGAEYPLRRAPMTAALDAVREGQSTTLGGCRAFRQDRRIWICREFNAVRRTRTGCREIWDGRWRLHGGDGRGCELRPLGRRGLMMCPDWRQTGRPHAALTASPSVWRDDDLVAAPLAGMANGWQAELTGGSEEFFASLLSH